MQGYQRAMTIALRVFLPFALTYMLVYSARVVNGVAGEDIMADLGLTPADLGFLTSVYLAGFALFQIPFGVVMDRFGPRKVESATLLLAVAGCALFAVAESFGELVVGRFMMGVGASMCLMAPFTAYRKWFSPERLPVVTGVLMVFGAAGSALAGRPAEAIIAAMGWHAVFAVLGFLTLLGAGAILFIVPARHDPPKGPSFAVLFTELAQLLANRDLWRLAPISATSQAGYIAVLGLWTGPWLRDVAGLSSAAAAWWLSATAVGMMGGFLGYGALAGRMTGSRQVFRLFMAGSVLFALTVVGIIVLPPSWGPPLWILSAALGSGGILTYQLLTRAFDETLAGRVNTTLNFLVFFFAFLVQWLFGVVLGFFPGAEGAASPLGYQVGLAILLALQAIAYLPLLVPPRVPLD